MSRKNLSESDIFITKLKFVLLGDLSVGKSSILLSFMSNKYSKQALPHNMEVKTTQKRIMNQFIKYELWDLVDDNDMDNKHLYYHMTDLFIIVFSVIDSDSFFNAFEKWYPDLKTMFICPNVIFIGNKIDLRKDEEVLGGGHIGREQAERLAKRFQCDYFETSTRNKNNIEEIFVEATKKSLKKKREIIEKKNSGICEVNLGGCCASIGERCIIF